MISVLKKIYRVVFPVKSPEQLRKEKIDQYLKMGRIPWSAGYAEYKWDLIAHSLTNDKLLNTLPEELPDEYGISIDERIVEYPWIFSNLSNAKTRILDAGSTFNFKKILDHPAISQKDLYIYTYNPEDENFNSKRVSYIYGDLRTMPFRNEWFDEIICQSTIEHVDMDNSLYGYEIVNNSKAPDKSYEYLKVIDELLRVLKQHGLLLITFPYGEYENHGFFQQFDNQMLKRIEETLNENGSTEMFFFRYFKNGWKRVPREAADDSESYNPHTGKGKLDDGAAHCRAVCCIKFKKS